MFKFKQSPNKFNVSDLKHIIFVYDKDIEPSADYNYEEVLSNVRRKYARIDTIGGIQVFDGVNLVGIATHMITIRYDKDMTSQNWIKHADKYFDILDIEDFNEEHRFMRLSCNIRGTTEKMVNLI